MKSYIGRKIKKKLITNQLIEKYQEDYENKIESDKLYSEYMDMIERYEREYWEDVRNELFENY